MQSDNTVHLCREPLVVGSDQRCAAFAPNEREELAKQRGITTPATKSNG